MATMNTAMIATPIGIANQIDILSSRLKLDFVRSSHACEEQRADLFAGLTSTRRDFTNQTKLLPLTPNVRTVARSVRVHLSANGPLNRICGHTNVNACRRCSACTTPSKNCVSVGRRQTQSSSASRSHRSCAYDESRNISS